jgi:hypothetical protein
MRRRKSFAKIKSESERNVCSRVCNESDFYAQILDTHSILQHVNTSRKMRNDERYKQHCRREWRKAFEKLMERKSANVILGAKNSKRKKF